MKKIIILLLTAITLGMSAQTAPQGISYQAIARNASGAVMAAQPVTVKFRLFNTFGSGTPAYEETHNVTTNALGYFNLVIGQGVAATGSFSSVTWNTGNASYEVYLNGTLLGSETKFFSAPYALYAQQAGGATAYQAGSGIAISGGTITNTAPNQTVSVTGSGVTGSYPNYTVTAGASVPTGTANGNTMWWSAPLGAWQQSSHLYNDNQHVGIGIGSSFSGKLHVQTLLNTDSSVIFADHVNAVARTAGVRAYVSGTSAAGQFNTAIIGGNFYSKNLGQGPAVGAGVAAESNVAGGTAIGLYATTNGTAANRWAAIFDAGGVKINDSLVIGGGGTAGFIMTRTTSGRAVWTNPSVIPGDNLGNHLLSQNLVTNGFFLSGSGSSNGIFINASGNVAINTNVPMAALDVNGNIRAASSRLYLGSVGGFNSGYTGLYENSGDLTLAVYNSSGGSTLFGNNTRDAVTVKKNNGYVGIGTTAPQYRLHVYGGIHTDSLFNMNGYATLPPVSPAGQGRLAFDGTKFKVSENGGPYVNLVNTQPVQFSAYGSTVSSFSTASLTPVSFQTIDYNVGGGFNGTVFTAPVAGLYHFDGMVTLNTTSASSGTYQLQLTNGGGTYRAAIVEFQGGQNTTMNQISVDLMLIAGQQIGLGVYNGSSSAVPVYSSNFTTYFTGHKVN